jgi:hypothetical protein
MNSSGRSSSDDLLFLETTNLHGWRFAENAAADGSRPSSRSSGVLEKLNRTRPIAVSVD